MHHELHHQDRRSALRPLRRLGRTELMKVAGVTDADADHETNTVQVTCSGEVDTALLAAAVEARATASKPSPLRQLKTMQADSDKTLRLLRTARGQIDGIIKMVEADRYCIDISTQLMATQSLTRPRERRRAQGAPGTLRAHSDGIRLAGGEKRKACRG